MSASLNPTPSSVSSEGVVESDTFQRVLGTQLLQQLRHDLNVQNRNGLERGGDVDDERERDDGEEAGKSHEDLVNVRSAHVLAERAEVGGEQGSNC